MADPRIVNLRDFRVTAMAEPHGRGRFFLPPDVARIDRATAYGNPVAIADLTDLPPTARRRAAIIAYRGLLTEMLPDQPTFLDPLQGKRLACWCAPRPCHGEVILEVLDMGVEAWLGIHAPPRGAETH